jgi:carboxylate-amine ligase
MRELFAITAHQQLVCGVQTQVGIPDRDLAARVLTRALPWAPVMAALAAGSPYWDETDTQFASYRTQVWDRWPSAGVTAGFESAAEYDAVVAALLESETIVDVGMVYFDIRLSAHQPTVEFRVCDSTPRIELVVALAGLWRALAATCIEELTSGRSALRPRVELLRAARWKASRFGLSADLLDPVNGAPAPAADVVAGLLDHVMPALRAAGDDGIVREEVDRTLREQGCAQRQRRAAAGGGGLVGVVDDLMSQTSPH